MTSLTKRWIQAAFRTLGYEVRRISSKTGAQIHRERRSDEYDEVWVNSAILKAYLTEERKELYRAILQFASQHHLLESSATIADCGCGPGYLLKFIYDRCRPQKLVGLDFSREVLAIASQSCPAAQLRQHDIYDPLNEKFHLLFCTEVLEHLRYPAKALDNLLRAATNVVISIPNGRMDTYGGHINYWSLESWNVFLEPYHSGWHAEVKYVCKERNLLSLLRRRAAEVDTDDSGKPRHIDRVVGTAG